MIVEHIINKIKQTKKSKPIIIAFDGVDTSGKTTLADAIDLSMRKQNVFEPIRVQIDRFHNPKEIRTQKGDLSPEGFFYDSFNLSAIYENIINPIKTGTKTIITGIYDYRIEQHIEEYRIPINNNSVILFDGIFMHRDELYKNWDLSIFLDISFETVLKRAIKRDIDLFSSEENIKKRYLCRYIPGEEIYLNSCNPKKRAHIVIDNNNFEAPKILKEMCGIV